MPNNRVRAAAEGMPKGAYDVVTNAEGDMMQVYDHALLLHHHLSQAARIDIEMQHALVWTAGTLVELGTRLRNHFDALHGLSRKEGAK